MKKAIFLSVTLSLQAVAQDRFACCFGSYCVNLPEHECIAAGGDWYSDSTCYAFDCPESIVEQLPNMENGLFSDLDCDICGGIQIIADNFSIQDRMYIRRLIFFGNYYPSLDPPDSVCFDVIFREDNDGLPGEEIARLNCMVPGVIELWVGSLNRLFCLDISEENIRIEPITFFVEIYTNTINNPDSWFWATGDLDPDCGIVGQAWTTTLPEEPWNYDTTTDMAIIIEKRGPTEISHDDPPVPGTTALSQNYPNPFNSSTNIRFTLPEPSNVAVEVYDILGRRVVVLFAGYKPAGSYSVDWNAADCSSGIYFARMRVGETTQKMKMVLMK